MSVFLYSSSSTRTTKSRIGCQIRISDAFSETSPLNNSLARSRTKFKNAWNDMSTGCEVGGVPGTTRGPVKDGAYFLVREFKSIVSASG